MACSYGALTALAPDVTVRWAAPTRDLFESEPLVDTDGTIYLGNGTALQAIGADGRWLWQVDLGDTIHTSPAIGPDGTLYVGCSDGYLYALGS
jgi:outer membrane protein assembly factor BamB